MIWITLIMFLAFLITWPGLVLGLLELVANLLVVGFCILILIGMVMLVVGLFS